MALEHTSFAFARAISRRSVLGGLLAAGSVGVGRAATAVSFLLPAPAFLPAFMPYHIARKRGYFSSHGLDVTFQTARGGADAAKQVAVGNAEFGGGVGETSIIVRSNGLPVRSVLLLGGKSLWRVAVREAAGVKSLSELKGKKIGVIGYQDTSYYSLLGVLAGSGLSKDDVRIEAVGAAGMTQLMIAGSLDAITATPDWADTIDQAHVPLTYFSPDKVFPVMAQAVFCSDKMIQSKPEIVQGFVQSIKRALLDCLHDPAAAARDFVAAVPQQAGREADMERVLRQYCLNVYATIPPSELGMFDPNRLKKVEDFYLTHSIIQKSMPVPDLYTNRFVEA